jgi:Reverse transcriptase (RNA-dependent DNA polymerase)
VRMCIDYRALNKLTERNEFPLPRIDELLDTLSRAKYFSVLDLDMVYHQVRLNEKDILKTAFTCSQGHYEFIVMIFGFINFQRMITQVFDSYLRKFVMVYLDNILIFSKTKKEHLEYIKSCLQKLRDNKLYAKMKKCTFGKERINYLRYVVLNKRVEVDEKKVEAMKE